MRGILIMAMFAASLTHAAWNDYVEARELRLDAADVEELKIDAGAGSLDVRGVEGADEIIVEATITVPAADDEEARELIASDMVLTLQRDGERAVLNSYFENRHTRRGAAPGIRLDVRVPTGLNLAVDDGSGSMEIRDVSGDIAVDDGSGSITLERVGGGIRIDDGSGSIIVDTAAGPLAIVDGSGSIRVRHVAGTVSIDDGSGSIDVRDVDADLIIEESGSGSVSFADIRGRVQQND